MCQFYFGGITVNGGCVNFKLAKMLRIKLALTLKRRNMQQRREKAKLLGICVECGAPSIPEESRCQACAERHRKYERESRERAAQKREQSSGQTRIF